MHYLTHEKDGSFDARTTFITSLILCADKRRTAQTSKALDFLLTEKSEYWTWNYWKTPYRSTYRLPDDMDDTCTALTAIAIHKPELLTPEIMANIVSLLISQEVTVGGPYYTWIVPTEDRADWNNIDIGVNANIAFLLHICQIPIPSGLQEYLDEIIESQSFESEFYTNTNLILYFLARSYSGKNLDILHQIVDTEIRNNHDNISVFLRAAYTHLHGMDILDTNQYPLTKNHIPEILYKESAHIDTETTVSSNILEQAITQEIISLTETHNLNSLQNSLYTEVTQILTESCPEILLPYLKERISTIRTSDQYGRISLMTYHIYQSLSYREYIPDQTLRNISLATIYGWIAYDIYDDITDKESTVSLLPIAISAHRRMTELFSISFPHTHRIHMHDYLDITDKTLSKPNPKNPENASYGHIITPVLLLTLAGYHPYTEESCTIQNFFTHILATRQICDDLHDIDEDQKAERLTSVTQYIQNNLSEEDATKTAISVLQDHISKAENCLSELMYFCDITYFKHITNQLRKTIAHEDHVFTEAFFAGV